MGTVKDYSTIILFQMPDRKPYYITVKANKNASFGRWKSCCTNLIGMKFGQLIRISSNNFYAVEVESDQNEQEYTSMITSGQDNRDIVANNQNQSLSIEEIQCLKRDHQGELLVQKLVDNSETFTMKTAFAQQKYLKRKKIKYDPVFLIAKPTIRNIIQIAQRYHDEILNLTLDSISYLLLMTNIRPSCRILVVDECMGLVLRALAERMAGREGTVFDWIVSENASPDRKFVKMYPLMNDNRISIQNHSVDENASNRFTDLSSIDSFVFVSMQCPIKQLKQCYKFLKPGCRCVIYNPFLEIVSDICSQLKDDPNYFDIGMSRTFCREYQVLPSRTHPHVKMNNSSGFVLTARYTG
ncbi:hypothetical protein GJ496_009430 [Pomphorhynchus laevis]|nr:hypothetical protein GJ496_009430 [Pomphorhynchus laevis]